MGHATGTRKKKKKKGGRASRPYGEGGTGLETDLGTFRGRENRDTPDRAYGRLKEKGEGLAAAELELGKGCWERRESQRS